MNSLYAHTAAKSNQRHTMRKLMATRMSLWGLSENGNFITQRYKIKFKKVMKDLKNMLSGDKKQILVTIMSINPVVFTNFAARFSQ